MPEPSHFHANLQRGTLLLNQDRPGEALPFLQAAIAANPDAPQGYAELARCFSEIPAQRARSIDAINRAIALAPENSFYHGRKGWFLVCLMRYHAALKTAKEGLALNPHCPQSLNAMANAYTKLNQWKKAEEVCRRILADDPNETAGLNLLAQALRHQGKWKETRQVIDHLLANVPNDAFGQSNAGYAALAAGDHLRANEHFLNSLRMDPHSDLARRGLLQSLRARNWIIRFNMRIDNFLRRKRDGRDFVFITLGFFMAIFGVGILAAGLEWIHRGAGEAALGFLLVAAIASILAVGVYIVLSLLVAAMGNFLLLFDPMGWHALKRQEKIKAAMPVVWFVLCAGTVIINGGWIAAIIVGVLVLIVAATVQIPLLYDRWQRRRMEQAGD